MVQKSLKVFLSLFPLCFSSDVFFLRARRGLDPFKINTNGANGLNRFPCRMLWAITGCLLAGLFETIRSRHDNMVYTHMHVQTRGH